MASNLQVEINALAHIMKRQSPELLVAVSTDMFGNQQLAKVFQLIRKFYVENSEFIGFDVLRAQVSKACKTEDMTKFMMSILEQVQGRDISGMTDDMMLVEMSEYLKFRTVLAKVDPLITAVEQQDISATLQHLTELYTKVVVDGENRLENADMGLMAATPIKFRFRKTGIKPIDDRGGLIEGGFTLLAGSAKAGKSTLACMIALHQYLNDSGSVLYASYEMLAGEVRSRIFANYADIDLGKLMSDDLAPFERGQLQRAEADFYCQLPKDFTVNLDLSREEYFADLYTKYPRRDNKFYVLDAREDWDSLFVKMELMATTKNVKCFVVDYITLVPRGAADKNLSSWEYILLQSKKLKQFAHKHQCNVITPMQYAPATKNAEDKIKFASNVINDCDLCLAIHQSEEDKTLDAVSVDFKAMRSFLSLPGEPNLRSFKLIKELNKGRFVYQDF